MTGMLRWRKLAKQLSVIERALHEWELAHPDEYRSLPWHDQRKEFKEQLAAGPVLRRTCALRGRCAPGNASLILYVNTASLFLGCDLLRETGYGVVCAT